MRAVVQRVSEARATVDGEVVGQIGAGLCVFIGIGRNDDEKRAEALAEKLKNLRIFEDAEGKMNCSVSDGGGELLVVSQFTLYGDCRRGNRPSFSEAATPDRAARLYQHFVERLRAAGLQVSTGRFQAPMRGALVNDGPVTLIVENT